MQSKVKVWICSGTACFVMGSSDILLLDEFLPEHMKDKVEIEGTMCLDMCKVDEKQKPPFVKVNDQVISEATVHKVLAHLEKEIV